MKLKKQKEYDLEQAIKDDTNGIIGSFVLTKIRTWSNPLKSKWNFIEQIFWTKELGYSLLTITNSAEPKVTRLVDKYPPETWEKTVFLKPKWKYNEKQIVELHNSIRLRLQHNGYQNMNCFSAAVMNHKIASDGRVDKKDVFDLVADFNKATVNDFTQNGNLQPIMLQGKK